MTVTLYIAATIDGFIARENGSVDFLAPFESKDEDFGYSDFYKTVDGVLLGRNTYDDIMQWVDEYPYGDRPSWIFTSRDDIEDSRISTFNGSVEDFAKQAPEGNLWLVGGGDLVTRFHNASLIDRYMIFTIPVMIGKGIPLFSSPCRESLFTLEETRSWPAGIVLNTWRAEKGKGK